MCGDRFSVYRLDDSKSIFYFEAIKCKVGQSLNILLDALVKKG